MVFVNEEKIRYIVPETGFTLNELELEGFWRVQGYYLFWHPSALLRGRDGRKTTYPT